MKKILKKLGNSLGITINKEERKIYDIEEGDILEVDITKLERVDD